MKHEVGMIGNQTFTKEKFINCKENSKTLML